MAPADVARKLKITRNVAIGRRYRLREAGAALPMLKNKVASPLGPAPTSHITLPTKVTIKAWMGPIELLEDHTMPDEAPAPQGLSILDLGAQMCRYQKEDGFFCGDPTSTPLRSYCDAHHAKCWFKPASKKKKAKPFSFARKVQHHE